MPTTRTVYVLFHETNTGHSDDSDGYIEDIFSTEAAAEAAKLAEIRRLIADGQDVYWNPDAPEGEEEGPSDWTDDFRVIPWRVKSRPAPPNPLGVRCPKCNAIADTYCHDGGARREKPHTQRARRAREVARTPARSTE